MTDLFRREMDNDDERHAHVRRRTLEKVCNAVVPPADAPMPTTGNDRWLFNVAGDGGRSLCVGARRAIDFS